MKKSSPVVAFLIFFVQLPGATLFAQSTWVLSDEQRRAFLHYYSPVILKRADENGREGKDKGHDWITNFNFDVDGNFSNNKDNWHDQKYNYIQRSSPNVENWQIRPALYTSLIEFMQNGQKTLVLLYHVYHAMQKNDIHDWERIEVRIDNINRNGSPGNGENIVYYVLTAHHYHNARLFGHSDLNYLDNTVSASISGKHLLIWQANWNGDATDPHYAELRFVEEDLVDFVDGSAEVEISGYRRSKKFHYIFVDGDAARVAEFLNATPISFENASEKASGLDNEDGIRTDEAIRITYELQDMADIFPTHWIAASTENINWGGDDITHINLLEPISNGTITVPAGVKEFFRTARNGSSLGERNGYPQKAWFWGTYCWDQGGLNKDSGTWTKGAYEEFGNVWGQHYYFLHDGKKGKEGNWLQILNSNWASPEHGGFDGRWINLFPD